MIRRGILLVVFLVAGYVLGNLVAHLVLIPIAAIKPLSNGLANALSAVGRVLIGFRNWRRRSAPSSSSDVHGSARWANANEVRSLVRSDGLIVGRENRKGGELLRYAGQQDLITIAPTRSGKGVGAIIPNLLTTDRSILCIDPKGENARVAVYARERFGPVYVLDPFGVSGVAAAFNPLDGLDEESPDPSRRRRAPGRRAGLRSAGSNGCRVASSSM